MDSAAIVNMLQQENHPHEALSILMRGCHELSNKFRTFALKHVFREANRRADHLAELGHSAGKGTTILMEPPARLLVLVISSCYYKSSSERLEKQENFA